MGDLISIALDDAAITHWQQVIRKIAREWQRKWAPSEDPSFLEDLCMAGWIAVMRWGLDHPYLSKKIRSAVLDAIKLWKYGHHDGGGYPRRRLTTRMPVEMLEVRPTLMLNPAIQAEFREIIHRIWQAATPRTQQVWCLLAEEWPNPLPRRRQCGQRGLKKSMIDYDIVRLRRLMQAAYAGPEVLARIVGQRKRRCE